MKNSFLLPALVAIGTILIGAPAIAADEHGHDHKVTKFESVTQGITMLDTLIAEARTKVGKGDFEGLHPTSEEVVSTAEGLESRIGDIKAENKERYKFNTEQLKKLATQLEEVHEAKNKDEAEKVAKRMESVRNRLKAAAQ